MPNSYTTLKTILHSAMHLGNTALNALDKLVKFIKLALEIFSIEFMAVVKLRQCQATELLKRHKTLRI